MTAIHTAILCCLCCSIHSCMHSVVSVIPSSLSSSWPRTPSTRPSSTPASALSSSSSTASAGAAPAARPRAPCPPGAAGSPTGSPRRKRRGASTAGAAVAQGALVSERSKAKYLLVSWFSRLPSMIWAMFNPSLTPMQTWTEIESSCLSCSILGRHKANGILCHLIHPCGQDGELGRSEETRQGPRHQRSRPANI